MMRFGGAVVVGWLWLAVGTAAAAEPFVGLFADGARVKDAELKDWHDKDAQPHLAGRKILEPGSPVRWVRRQNAGPAALPEEFVEFVGGDRLPGTVVGYQAGGDDPYEQLPPHLLVKPSIAVHPPEQPPQDDAVRVSLALVRRVVWANATERSERPATVTLRNGGSVPFRSLRWGESRVTLLTAQGLREVDWGDIAQIHFAAADAWQAYAQTLASLSPELNGRLVRITTGDGARLLASTERFHAHHHGDRNRLSDWYQLVQPAWALDPLDVRVGTVQDWTFFDPLQPPVSWFEPTSVERAPVFGASWTPRTDQNLHGELLQIGDEPFGSGFAVQGSTSLRFAVPPLARKVRTRYGLDRSAGPGGCVKFLVQAGDPAAPQTLHQSETIVGTQPPKSTEWLDLPAASESNELRLVVDMAHEGRPAGADPFDVRDAADWADAEWQLDRDALQAAVNGQAVAQVPGLAGWTPGAGAALKVRNRFDQSDGQDKRFRTVLVGSGRLYTFSRKQRIGPADRWLMLNLSRFQDNTTPSKVLVSVDGKALGHFDVPGREGAADPRVPAVSAAPFQGKTVTVELAVLPAGDRSEIDWRSVGSLVDRPGIMTLYEDDAKFAALLGDGDGLAMPLSEGAFSGTSALQVSTGGRRNPQIDAWAAPVREQPRLGQFRFVAFAWKRPEKGSVSVHLAHDGEFADQRAAALRPQFKGKPAVGRVKGRVYPLEDRGLRHGYSYDASNAKQSAGAPLRLDWNSPKEWQLQTRDLFGDFGNLTLTGIGFNTGPEGMAQFDHIYLARTPQDLEYVRQVAMNPPAGTKVDPLELRRAKTVEEYGPLTSAVMPQFALNASRDGVAVWKEFGGEQDVLRTQPSEPGREAIFTTARPLPAGPSKLVARVASHPGKEWRLVVRVNGEEIHQQPIKAADPNQPWHDVAVDLARFAGQPVVVEVVQRPNQWHEEFGYWKRLEIVSP